MTTEKITIHKALAELKVIDSRIEKAIKEGVYVTTNKHSNEKIKGVPLAEYKTSMKASYDKAVSLIERRNAIKRAVVLSNATTKVVINGVEYTVAEAIEMKNNGITYKEKLLYVMSTQLTNAELNLSLHTGEAVERDAEKYILAVIAAQPKDAKATTDSEEMKKLRATYIENNTFDLIDPLSLKAKIEALSEEINNFAVEVDAVLSTSNAITEIEVNY